MAHLRVRHDAEPQKALHNSVQQLRNVHDKLGIEGDAVLAGPVLLVHAQGRLFE